MTKPESQRSSREIDEWKSSNVASLAKITAMKHSVAGIVVIVVQAILVLGFALGLSRQLFALGVPGEWEWLRIAIRPDLLEVVLALVATAIYATLAGVGFAVLRRKRGRGRELAAILLLTVLAFPIQAAIQGGAPIGYGLAKWIIALHQRGSSGYFSVASTEVADLPSFLADYPEWIAKQDPLHIGTHPPGLIVIEHTLLRIFEANPGFTRVVDALAPDAVALAAKVYVATPPLRPADRATLVVTGALIMLACSITVLPLYALARTALRAEHAWVAAVLWPLVPSAILFQPTADTAFASLATLALALAAASLDQSRSKGIALAIAAGLGLGVGMQLSLVFLPIGLIVGLLLLIKPDVAWKSRLTLILTVGVGFLLATMLFWWLMQANPFRIWWWNQANHARFYTTYPRSYLKWVLENPIELSVGLGLPAAILGLVGLRWPSEIPRAAWITALVLAGLTLSGKNLSEVGRLWIPFMPTLLVGAGFSSGKLGLGSKGIAVMVFLTGVQTLCLEAFIQVVYPV